MSPLRPRLRTAALLAAVYSLLGAAAADADPTVTDVSNPSPAATTPVQIASQGGSLWFTEQDNPGGLGRVTVAGLLDDWAFGSSFGGSSLRDQAPTGIAAGPDGEVWVALAGGDIATATTPSTGTPVVQSVPLPSGARPFAVVEGPDDAMWFTDQGSTPSIGRVDLGTGAVVRTPVSSDPWNIAVGSDGNLWFTEKGADRIGRITPAGDVTEFGAGAGLDQPHDITAGPDGNLWFTESGGAVSRITPSGTITRFTLGLSGGDDPRGIEAGPDGNLWIVEMGTAKFARVTTSGAITEFPAAGGSRPIGITAGPDGRMWFTQSSLDQIGAFTVGPGLTATDVSGVTATGATATGSVTGSGALPTTWYVEYGTTSGYGQRTAGGTLPASPSAAPVGEALTGLLPGTLYHFRLVASNAAGTTYGPDTLLATQAAQTPTPTPTPPVTDDTPPATPAPVLGKSVVAGTVSGVVRFRRPGGRGYVMLKAEGAIPAGSIVDAKRGTVRLITALPGGKAQEGTFNGGSFDVRQSRAKSAKGMVDLTLRGSSFASCPKPGSEVAAAGRRVRRLWGRDRRGRFRTHGRNSVATVHGTRWLTEDRCDGTLTRVTEGAVSVRATRGGKRKLVRAGGSYFVKVR